MRQTKNILRGIAFAGIVIVCCLWASQRSRWYSVHTKRTGRPPSHVFGTIRGNGTGQRVANVNDMCKVPLHLSAYVEEIKKNSSPGSSDANLEVIADHERQINEFSIHRKLDRYPLEGTGKSVENVSDYFDPAVFNTFCETAGNLTAVVPVYSTADRFVSRYLLRNSLGRLATLLNCKIFFIVGMSTYEGVNSLLQEEYATERDILMIDKIDTYRDLNNKAYAMIQWISKFCNHVPYVIHIIDDTYVNLRRMLKTLHGIDDEYYILARKADTKTIRTSEPKSFVTVEEYVYEWFPVYAYGMVYAFPSRVAERLLAAAHSATYCWIEDVWIGGHVRIAANVSLVEFGSRQQRWSDGGKGSCIASHPVDTIKQCRWYKNDSPRFGIHPRNAK